MINRNLRDLVSDIPNATELKWQIADHMAICGEHLVAASHGDAEARRIYDRHYDIAEQLRTQLRLIERAWA